MSGIAGILHRDGRPASPDDIAVMCAAIAHRGPDGSGISCAGHVALAHRLLSTTPESSGERQPVVSEPAGTRLVADARIDNRDELMSALSLTTSDRVSDAQLIACAYRRWGARCIERLVGDFAFALWDDRSQEMFCGRDPMGVKPFYFFASERLFAFASEAKALLALPGVPNDVDDAQVVRFIEGRMDDRTGTLFRFVHRLPAAHTMTVTRAGVRQQKYWDPSAARDVRFSTSDQYAEAFREIFTEAVKARLRTEDAVGATLSGGLDSSSIVCMARQIQRGTRRSPLHTFSLVFPSLPEKDLRLIDERRYIDAVVGDGGVLPTWVRGDELSPTAEVGTILDQLDEPYAAPNLYLHRGMYRAAQQRGARVLLDGFDGDTAVSHGFARLNTLLRRGDWDTFEHEIRALAAHREMRLDTIIGYFGLPYLALLARHGRWVAWARAARELTRRFGVSTHTLASHGIRPALPRALRTAYHSIRARHNGTRPLSLRENGRTARERDRAELREQELDVMYDERESHVHGLSQPAYQLTLEMADKCAAAFGVEPRYPYFDRRLIDYCVGLPDSEKLKNGWPRHVFRRAMEGILPAEIQWRSDKGNLSPNFHRALRASTATRVDVSANSPLAAFVDLTALRAMRRQYCEETSTLGRSVEGHTLFRIDVLECWLSRAGRKTDQEREVSSPHAPAAA